MKEQPFEYVPWAPAGGMSVSGEDIGRFMLAHLNDGALGDGRILRAETARTMRGKLTSFSPKINGMLHGFMESNWNGVTVYGHVATPSVPQPDDHGARPKFRRVRRVQHR